MLILQYKQGTLTVNFEHNQSSPSLSWAINHNLEYYPIIRVYTSTGEEIQPESIIHNSVNQATITFTSASTGTAVLV